MSEMAGLEQAFQGSFMIAGKLMDMLGELFRVSLKGTSVILNDLRSVSARALRGSIKLAVSTKLRNEFMRGGEASYAEIMKQHGSPPTGVMTIKIASFNDPRFEQFEHACEELHVKMCPLMDFNTHDDEISFLFHPNDAEQIKIALESAGISGLEVDPEDYYESLPDTQNRDHEISEFVKNAEKEISAEELMTHDKILNDAQKNAERDKIKVDVPREDVKFDRDERDKEIAIISTENGLVFVPSEQVTVSEDVAQITLNSKGEYHALEETGPAALSGEEVETIFGNSRDMARAKAETNAIAKELDIDPQSISGDDLDREGRAHEKDPLKRSAAEERVSEEAMEPIHEVNPETIETSRKQELDKNNSADIAPEVAVQQDPPKEKITEVEVKDGIKHVPRRDLEVKEPGVVERESESHSSVDRSNQHLSGGSKAVDGKEKAKRDRAKQKQKKAKTHTQLRARVKAKSLKEKQVDVRRDHLEGIIDAQKDAAESIRTTLKHK